MTKTKITGDVKLSGLKTAIEDTVAEALDEIGVRAVELIREELQSGARSGKLVERRGRPHQASAPGEAPANWSGALAASLDYEAGQTSVRVFADQPYGDYLEYGTLRVAPRPFIGPVMERLAPEINAIVARAFDKSGKLK